jgi:hypothetical protein
MLLSEIRRETDTEFNAIFGDVTKLCNEHDIEIRISRLTGRQVHCCNIMAGTPEDYYRIAIYIPFLDLVQMQIHDQLLKRKTIFESVMCFFAK